jgi:hypothetical protein
VTLVRTASDTFVNQVLPAGNYGGTAKLWVSNAGSAEKLGLVYFKRPFPLGATIISATLRLTAAEAWSGSQTLTAKRIVAKWTENKVTYNSRPSTVATNAGSVVVTGAAAGDPINIDVTNLLGDVASGGAFFGFQLSLSTTSVRKINSTDIADATLRPYLDVTWSSPPDVPVNLRPAAGHIVAVTKPVLAWDYADQDGAGTQTSSQIQIATSPTGFGSPEYDSGKVANSQSQWDLSATAYAGVPAGATRYWRVQVWDDTNLASGWSDVVSFTQGAKGALTLLSPTTATVDDLTPPISWSLSGATQEAYRVFITATAKIARRSPILWDTGKVTDGATTTVHPPAGIIYSGQAAVFVTVQVWDTADRQSIVGDTSYLQQVSPNFTYSRSGVPGNVPTLTAVLSPTSSSPGVLLTWTRSAQPDWFALKVDGVEVLPRIDPTSVFVSGTTYQLLYWGSNPRVAHTYEVEAVVISGAHSQHSSGNATASATTNPTGVWLVDQADGTAVNIRGPNDSSQFAIGESGVTYDLPGGRAPIRIVDSIRGYEGSIDGNVLSKADRDTFLKLKGRVTTLQLIISDLSIPVSLEEAVAAPTQLAGDRMYGVSFGFVQTGSFTFDVSGG